MLFPKCRQKTSFWILLTASFIAVSASVKSSKVNLYPYTAAYQEAAKFLEASIDTSVNPCKTQESSNPLNIPIPHMIKPDEPNYEKYKQIQDSLQASMNLSADPCNDFYEYACGAFDGELSFQTVRKRNLRIMAKMMDGMLEDDYDGDMLDSTAISKTLEFYSACMEAADETNGIGTFEVVKEETIIKDNLDDFKELTGYKFNWCEMNNKNTNKNSKILAKALAHLRYINGIDTLITPSIIINPKRDPRFASNFSLYIDQNTVTREKGFYQKRAWTKLTYKNLKENMLQLFEDYTKSVGMECDAGILEYHVEDVLEFEHLLATNFSVNEYLRRNDSRNYNPMKVGEMPYKFLDWKTYITVMQNITETNFVDVEDIEDYWIVIAEPEAMKNLDNYMARNGIDTVVKYLYYRLLLSLQNYIEVDEEDNENVSMQHFRNPLIGKKRQFKAVSEFSDRNGASIRCVKQTANYFPMAAGRIFVEALHPTPAARDTLKTETLKVIDSIKTSLQSMVEEMLWISANDETIKAARYKFSNLQINAAFPDFIFDNEKLDEVYEGIEFNDDDVYETMLEKLHVFSVDKSFNRLLPGTAVDRTKFHKPLWEVGASYSDDLNSITIPIGILQHPFFDPNWPASVLFSAVGAVIGHEITHAFDDKGIQYNGDGILDTWMDKNAQKAFNKMAECIINEYGNFTVIKNKKFPIRKINGYQTQGENIADNGGIRAAYNSYRQWVSLNGQDPQLPDRILGQLNHEQLFFLSYARKWCQHMPNDSSIYRRILTDPHSPGKFRVFGTLQNFPAFRAAFNCPINSVWAPQKHCNVWVSKN